MANRSGKLSANAAWCMAVGGMIGGGIFSVLGVVYEIAGRFAWLSFLIGGAIALATSHSYAKLAVKTKQSGGAYAFLRDAGHRQLAANLALLLILGYALTLSVYAYTFGAYVAYSFGASAVVQSALSVGVLVLVGGVNLIGVGEASFLEVFTVWGKLAVLAVLAAIGIWAWAPDRLSPVHTDAGWTAPLVASGVIFMAYEGFQLLAYDYDDISNAEQNLSRILTLATVTVIAVYVALSLGAAMLVGADTLIEQKEVALAAAGRAALGHAGLLFTVAAAAFSTASAINATIFSTARLGHRVACEGGLPKPVAWRNRRDMPWIAILGLTGMALAMVLLGSLSGLVESASLMFLITFTIVNYLAVKAQVRPRWIPIAGGLGSAAATAVLLVRDFHERPLLTGGVAAALGAAAVLRHVTMGRAEGAA